MVVEGLASLGTVDVCVLDAWRTRELELEWPEWVGDAEWCEVTDTPAWGAKVMLGLASPVRRVVLARDAQAAAVTRFFSKTYDLTWCEEPRGFEPVAHLVTAPVVLDLHNVLSSSVAHKRRLVMRRPWLLASWREAINDPEYLPGLERRWQTWEQSASERCDQVVVCSEVDRARIGPHAAVIPNCYRSPAVPAGRAHVPGAPLRIGFVGLLDYQPNFDAVRWFATAVLPRIREQEPGATFEVIGQASPGVQSLSQLPGVHLHGFVEDLELALAELTVVVAPIRFGGGTRFKILEGFAHHLPVVSTTVGAEGIEAVDGEHLLVRDDPAAFARAVLDLHRDKARREKLVTAAAGLHAERYAWERGVAAVRQQVAALMSSTVSV
jgi:glycosyltransferase involved in cell wall biosynthesis